MKRRSARPFSVEIIKRTRPSPGDAPNAPTLRPHRDIWQDMLRSSPELEPEVEPMPAPELAKRAPEPAKPDPVPAAPARRVLPSLALDATPSLAPPEPEPVPVREAEHTADEISPPPRRRGRPPKVRPAPITEWQAPEPTPAPEPEPLPQLPAAPSVALPVLVRRVARDVVPGGSRADRWKQRRLRGRW